MRIVRMIVVSTAAAVLAAGPVFAEGDGDRKSSPKNDTLKKVDAIFNEIMLSLPQEMKAKIDSARIRSDEKKNVTVAADSTKQAAEGLEKSAQEQKNRLTEELSKELRLQIENAIQEMEKRKNDRDVELKEMQRRGN
jgi:hypothetical protein